MNDLNVREATSADTPAIVSLWRELMDYHAALDPFFRRAEGGEERFAEWVDHQHAAENGIVLVAVADGQVIGYLLGAEIEHPPVFAERRAGTIYDLAVTDPHRRAGVGSHLLEHALGWFGARGLNRVECRVARANELASSFWRKQGFGAYLEALCRTI